MRKNERIFVFSAEKQEFLPKIVDCAIVFLGCRGMALGGEAAPLAGAKKWTIAKNTC